MHTRIHDSKDALGRAAAACGAEEIKAAIAQKGAAAIVVATGASQFDTLAHLVTADLDWSKVTAFHLDEYVGISPDHPASFRRYLRERFVDKLPALGQFVEIAGDAADLQAEVARLGNLIAGVEIDVCFAGIGENGHLAFNDPPADFETEAAYLVVELDEACRRQQMGEGWFATLDEVPGQAISMSIRQMMKSRRLVLSVPDSRKAQAVKASLEGSVTPDVPASMVQRHGDVWLHLDGPSASLLQNGGR
ncbi:glucosamine-6-phosphate deaminase [Frigidibacter sp. ROC022]|uniref:glucosamine-6-phosphate deaminase n=1 Tax=Frigidibacter sp. ROC022 TaxID=2971796 RepID=UPI00215AF3A4|nr:glucosamine-6-phosphate deaminase [Frigidibacter sp. ROC022]MCR8725097.1 glucosamine-6-phosphate deaminase [Frigidibacter sp. ROC022]